MHYQRSISFILLTIMTSSAQAQNIIPQPSSLKNTITEAVVNSIYNFQGKPNNKEENQSQVLKSINLNPKSNASDINPGDSNELLLKDLLTQQNITDSNTYNPNSNQVDLITSVQCVKNNLYTLYSDKSSNFGSLVYQCYQNNYGGNTQALNDAKALFNDLQQSNEIKSFADLTAYKLKIDYCKADATNGLQSRLKTCSNPAAEKLLEDFKERWWSKFKTMNHAVELKTADINAIENVFANLTTDQAKDSAHNLSTSIQPIIDVAQADLITFIANKVQKINGAKSLNSGIDLIFNTDKFENSTNKTCWANNSPPNNQQVAISINNPSNLATLLKNINANFQNSNPLYQTIPIQEEVYFSIDGSNRVAAVTTGQISAANDKYWKNGVIDTETLNQAIDFRKNNITMIKQQQLAQANAARISNSLNTIGLSNLMALIKLRTPSKQFYTDSGSCSSKYSSAEEWSKTTAFMRQNSNWNQAIKQAQLADTMKQATILLSEIRTQLYLNNQLLQRLVASSAVTQLSNAASTQAATDSTLDKDIKNYITGGDHDPSDKATQEVSSQIPEGIGK